MKKAAAWAGKALDVALAVIAVIVIAMYVNLFLMARANADGLTEEVMVLCEQESEAV